MARQSLVWTALPNGRTPDGTGLRLSVMLSPRLDPQQPGGGVGTLGTFFPDWKDWPQTLAAARVDVHYQGVTVAVPATSLAGANRVDTTIGRADPAVWQALFDAATPVVPFRFADLSPSVLLSYDTVAVAEMIEKLYRDLARSAGDGMPRVTELLETERWRGFIGAVSELDATSVNRVTGLRDPRRAFDRLRRGSLGRGDVLDRFQLFHTPPSASVVRQEQRRDDTRIGARWREHRRTELPRRDDLAATIDFHRIVAAMGSYPTLLRRLGLVVDLVLDAAAFAPVSDADLAVNVVFPAGALAVPRTADGAPVTRARLSATHFDAVGDPAADNAVADGLLVLDADRYRLLQVDVDGAGLKAMNFARSLRRRFAAQDRVDPVTRHEDAVGAPALRTAGLVLVQRQRAGMLESRFAGNKTRNAQLEAQLAGAPGSVRLHAQDLTRGYRIDIWDSVSRRWHSLCRRTAQYAVGAPPVTVTVAPEEEATVRLAATRASDGGANHDVLYLHEALVAWTGWSLAARPPGRAILPDDRVDRTRDETAAEAPPGIAFASDFAPVQGSLPRLRFGRAYWIRARAVDLAGNSLPPRPDDFRDERPEIHAQRYLRYEPVAAPVTALLSSAGALAKPQEGESMQRIAIRSFNDTPASNAVPSPHVAHRVLAPPQVSVRDAEHHGMLDANGKVDAGLFDLLARQKDLDPRDPSAGIREVRLALQGPLDTAASSASYAVHEQGRALTYLPDPLATEVAVRVFDHPNIADTTLIRIPLYPGTARWPDARPFAVEVYDDPSAPPSYDAATHTLRVPLPKAVRAQLRVSMTLAPAALALLGVYQWLAPADQAAQRARALAGQHWMLTPWSVLEAVHAVQRPLLAPHFLSLAILERTPGQTSALPMAQVVCSIASTDRLDLFGEWHEPRDDPDRDGAGPVDRARRDVAFSVKVTGPAQYAGSDSVAPGVPEHSVVTTDVIALNSAAHARIAAKAHEFHDTRYRRIEYWFAATSRFREFLPAALLTTMENGEAVPTEANITVTGARHVAWVPNAAPPPAPKVLYVVPTFAWRRAVDAQGVLASSRRGGGVRVYLDRGWNASGYGEMLGVVLPPREFAGDPDTAPAGAPYKKYVTLWGNDPVWDSAFVPGLAPALAHFPLARTAPDPAGAWLPPNAPADEKDQRPGPFAVTSLPTSGAQRGGGAVDVAPHDVFWDAERELWYCDIEIDAGAAYFPFVRLALARYQPTSSPGAHLSDVVLSDIVALTPDRWLNVTPVAQTRSARVAVYGIGPDDSSGHRETAQAPANMRLDPVTGLLGMATPVSVAGHTTVEVSLERLDPAWGEDFGWRRVEDAVVTQRVPGGGLLPLAIPAALQSLPGNVATEAAPASPARSLQAQLAHGVLAGQLALWRTLWEGDVAVPDGGDRYRLVVAEYEEYVVDDSRPYDRTPTRKGRRMVFVETVELG